MGFALKRLYHVHARTLLLIVGIIAASTVLLQLFELRSAGSILSLEPAPTVSLSLKITNATQMSKSESTSSHIVPMEGDLGENYGHLDEIEGKDIGHDQGVYNDKDPETFSGLKEDGDLGNLTNEKGGTLHKYLTSRAVTSAVNVSTGKRGVQQGNDLPELSNCTLHCDGVSNNGSAVMEAHNRKSFISSPPVSPKFFISGLDLAGDAKSSGFYSSMNLSLLSNLKRDMLTPRYEHSELFRTAPITLNNNSHVSRASGVKRKKVRPMSISQMSLTLLQGFISSGSKQRFLSKRERELLSAKSYIMNAPMLRSGVPGLHASLFRNISVFKRSYDLMERRLKVYVYKEGERPIFHMPKLGGIYASEGWFMKLMEGNRHFVVKDPRKAHLFYIPFSSKQLRDALEPNRPGLEELQKHLRNYLELVAGKYPFWNRTKGADHFVVACHDWVRF